MVVRLHAGGLKRHAPVPSLVQNRSDHGGALGRPGWLALREGDPVAHLVHRDTGIEARALHVGDGTRGRLRAADDQADTRHRRRPSGGSQDQ
jgi:hypothetical protein